MARGRVRATLHAPVLIPSSVRTSTADWPAKEPLDVTHLMLIAMHYYLIKVKGISLPFWHKQICANIAAGCERIDDRRPRR